MKVMLTRKLMYMYTPARYVSLTITCELKVETHA